jgi:hypothetical protein
MHSYFSYSFFSYVGGCGCNCGCTLLNMANVSSIFSGSLCAQDLL